MTVSLAHLSDLHFGREDPRIAEALLRSLEETRPNLIIISGDLTQRARKRQFRAAAAFLKQLPRVPCLIVPGNHDVSATNLYERLTHPLRRYKRFITRNLSPSYRDADVAVAGINTVRLLARKDGRINRRQVAEACAQLALAPSQAIRIVVTHHPMDIPLEDEEHALTARAPMAMEAFAHAGVDLFLSGHLHAGHTLTTFARYPVPGWRAIVAQAGTSISTRTRNEPNAWNLVQLSPGAITIQQMQYQADSFVPGRTDAYQRGPDGWFDTAFQV